VKAPTIHINGTDGAELFAQVCAVLGALRALRKAQDEAQPNGRDYYPQGEGALRAATLEHQARVDKVRELIGEYQALAEAIVDASLQERS